jgi:ABC-type antimicrobial peptide transport system permease subunit
MAGVLVPLGITAMTLAAFGLFTLLMQFVATRRRELAIRISLGASPRRIVLSLVGEGLKLTMLGTVAGLAGAVVAGRALGALMFGVAPSDPITLASVLVVTFFTTLAAVWLPARRAAAVDPAVVLRGE